MTQQQIDAIAAEIVRDEQYLVEEAVAMVQSEPARTDYGWAGIMGVEK